MGHEDMAWIPNYYPSNETLRYAQGDNSTVILSVAKDQQPV